MDLFAETEIHYRNVYRYGPKELGRAYHVDNPNPVPKSAMAYRIKVYPKTEAIRKFREQKRRKIVIRFSAVLVALLCGVILLALGC